MRAPPGRDRIAARPGGTGEGAPIGNALAPLLRMLRLAAVSAAVGGVAWTAALPMGLAAADTRAATSVERASPAARGAPPAGGPVPVTLRIDGLETVASARSGQDVGGLLASLGVAIQAADRVSVDPATAVLPGMRIDIDRGVPVTLVDGGVPAQIRSARGTVGELLGATGIVLGALDSVDTPVGAAVAPGAVVRITRVVERHLSERVAIPFRTERVDDAQLDSGRETVVRPGEAGEAERAWLVRYVDGSEAGRVLLAETQLRAPVPEEVRVGTRRPAPAQVAPPAPAAWAGGGDIEGIIRDAAARWGADPNQLLRVARCESGLNPNAYNGLYGASGIFQFLPSTWAANAPRAGYAGASVFDPVANANTAAMMFARGQAGQWVCK